MRESFKGTVELVGQTVNEGLIQLTFGTHDNDNECEATLTVTKS